LLALLPRAGAQPTAVPTANPLDPAGFLRLAHSSALLQARAAQLVASRETRPEARAFAQKMVEFRREQLPRLEAAARDHQLAVPSVQEFEHQGVLENLEPLDFFGAQPSLRGDPSAGFGAGSAWLHFGRKLIRGVAQESGRGYPPAASAASRRSTPDAESGGALSGRCLGRSAAFYMREDFSLSVPPGFLYATRALAPADRSP
jgi:hypothetical protein